jgi:hypothetical protein
MRAYRLPEQTIFEIERLSEQWECTHADVIERAVAALVTGTGAPQRRKDGAGSTSELEVDYDVE